MPEAIAIELEIVHFREVVASCKRVRFKRNFVSSGPITVREPEYGHFDDVIMLHWVLVPNITKHRLVILKGIHAVK